MEILESRCLNLIFSEMQHRKLTFYMSYERSGPKDSVDVFIFVLTQLVAENLQIMWFYRKAEQHIFHNSDFAEKRLISTAANFSTN